MFGTFFEFVADPELLESRLRRLVDLKPSVALAIVPTEKSSPDGISVKAIKRSFADLSAVLNSTAPQPTTLLNMLPRRWMDFVMLLTAEKHVSGLIYIFTTNPLKVWVD